jgi:hypothetical protein
VQEKRKNSWEREGGEGLRQGNCYLSEEGGEEGKDFPFCVVLIFLFYFKVKKSRKCYRNCDDLRSFKVKRPFFRHNHEINLLIWKKFAKSRFRNKKKALIWTFQIWRSSKKLRAMIFRVLDHPTALLKKYSRRGENIKMRI